MNSVWGGVGGVDSSKLVTPGFNRSAGRRKLLETSAHRRNGVTAYRGVQTFGVFSNKLNPGTRSASSFCKKGMKWNQKGLFERPC